MSELAPPPMTPEQLCALPGAPNIDAFRMMFKRSFDGQPFDRSAELTSEQLAVVRAKYPGLFGLPNIKPVSNARQVNAPKGRTTEQPGSEKALEQLRAERSAIEQQREQLWSEQKAGERRMNEQIEQFRTEQEASGQARAEQLRRIEQAEQRLREQREQFQAEQKRTEQRKQSKRDRLVTGLAWCINGIEMVFILASMTIMGGFGGFCIGAMIVFTGCLVQFLVGDKNNVESGGAGLTIWFFVCALVAWLAEYPALKLYFERTEQTLPLSLEWYAGLMAGFVALLSFCAVYLRRQKSMDNLFTS